MIPLHSHLLLPTLPTPPLPQHTSHSRLSAFSMHGNAASSHCAVTMCCSAELFRSHIANLLRIAPTSLSERASGDTMAGDANVSRACGAVGSGVVGRRDSVVVGVVVSGVSELIGAVQ